MTLALQLRSRESTPQLLVRTLARALAMPPAESEAEGESEEESDDLCAALGSDVRVTDRIGVI